MGIKELSAKEGEQLTLKGFELAEVVREIDSIDIEKKEANEEWNSQLKALKKRMIRLANELKDAK